MGRRDCGVGHDGRAGAGDLDDRAAGAVAVVGRGVVGVVGVGGVDPDQAGRLVVVGAAEVDDVGVGRVDRQADVVVPLGRDAGVGVVAAADVVVLPGAVVRRHGLDGLDVPLGDRRQRRDLQERPVGPEVLGLVQRLDLVVRHHDGGVEPAGVEQVLGRRAGERRLGQDDPPLGPVGRRGGGGDRHGGVGGVDQQRVPLAAGQEVPGLALVGAAEDADAPGCRSRSSGGCRR